MTSDLAVASIKNAVIFYFLGLLKIVTESVLGAIFCMKYRDFKNADSLF